MSYILPLMGKTDILTQSIPVLPLFQERRPLTGYPLLNSYSAFIKGVVSVLLDDNSALGLAQRISRMLTILQSLDELARIIVGSSLWECDL